MKATVYNPATRSLQPARALNPSEQIVYRSTRSATARPALNDQGILYTTPDESYSRYFGQHTQRLIVTPKRTLDFTRFGAEQDVSAEEMAEFLSRNGVKVSSSLMGLFERVGSSEVLQYFGQYAKRALVNAIKRAGYDSARIREYVDGYGRAESLLLFSSKLAKLDKGAL